MEITHNSWSMFLCTDDSFNLKYTYKNENGIHIKSGHPELYYLGRPETKKMS